MNPRSSPRFSGKVALVTGSSRGLGQALGKALAREGASVVFNSSRTPFDGALVASAANQEAGQAIYVKADVASESDIAQIAELIEERFGRIDVIIHNAADGLECCASEVSWDDFERTFRTNTFALIALARSMAPLMNEGKLLYVSSFGADRAVPGYGVVGASKAASEALVRSLAMELAPRIQVNTLRPAIIPTLSLRAFSLADEFLEMASHESPMGLGTIDDIVESALFLCSPEAGFITGQVLTVDGGMGTSVFRSSWAPAAIEADPAMTNHD